MTLVVIAKKEEDFTYGFQIDLKDPKQVLNMHKLFEELESTVKASLALEASNGNISEGTEDPKDPDVGTSGHSADDGTDDQDGGSCPDTDTGTPREGDE